ncbi:5775_t:CDS:2, partial [Dentiscutata heterogama]
MNSIFQVGYENALFNRLSTVDLPQKTLNQMIKFVRYYNVMDIWVLNKVLDNYSKSQQLIKLLKEFVEEVDDNNLSDSEESLQGDSTSDKENYDSATEIQIQSSKKHK